MCAFDCMIVLSRTGPFEKACSGYIYKIKYTIYASGKDGSCKEAGLYTWKQKEILVIIFFIQLLNGLSHLYPCISV